MGPQKFEENYERLIEIATTMKELGIVSISLNSLQSVAGDEMVCTFTPKDDASTRYSISRSFDRAAAACPKQVSQA